MPVTRYSPTLIVLLYHHLFPGHRLEGWQLAATDYMTGFDVFRRDVEWLKQDPRIRFITPDAFFECAPEPCPQIHVYITFDDGYYSTGAALAYLAAEGIPAAVFVNSGLVGTGELAWPEKLLCFFHSLGTSEFTALLGDHCWSIGRNEPLGARIETFVRLREYLKTVATDEREAFLTELYRRYDFRLERVREDLAFSSLRLLDWADIAWIASVGFEVGGHTRTHVMLPACTADRMRDEIVGDRRELETFLGRPPRLFAVPNGAPEDHNDEVIAVCRESAYEFMFSAFGGVNNLDGDQYVLNRCDVGNQMGDVRALIDQVAAEVVIEPKKRAGEQPSTSGRRS